MSSLAANRRIIPYVKKLTRLHSRSSVELAGRSSKPNLPGNVRKAGQTFEAVWSNRRCCVDTNTEQYGNKRPPSFERLIVKS